MELVYEIAGALLTSFALNAIPFAGPSNLFIASNIAIASKLDPLLIGLLVAFGSATAKFIHYIVTFYVGKYIGEERRRRLDATGLRLKRWAFIALFIVAASPLPDEPIIIPLGLLRYNPGKLFLAYFTGKLVIAIAGAYLGRAAQEVSVSFISQEILIATSIIITVAITIILLKIDVGRLAEKIMKRRIPTQQCRELSTTLGVPA